MSSPDFKTFIDGCPFAMLKLVEEKRIVIDSVSYTSAKSHEEVTKKYKTVCTKNQDLECEKVVALEPSCCLAIAYATSRMAKEYENAVTIKGDDDG